MSERDIMFGTHDFMVFLMAGIAFNILPGPDTMYIVGRSIAQGRNAGFLSALGVSSGALIHTTAAALGLSAILFTSAFAFSVVKWAGAAYLIYLGLHMIIQKGTGSGDVRNTEVSEADYWVIYRQGFITNLLNPKVAMFFMAFLPQFVAVDHASSPFPFLFLGSILIFTGTVWFFILAAIASTVSKVLLKKSRSLQFGRRVTGLIFMGLGVRLVLQGR